MAGLVHTGGERGRERERERERESGEGEATTAKEGYPEGRNKTLSTRDRREDAARSK